MSARLNTCAECGAAHERAGAYCSTRCRQAFNNRRLQRGGEIYDLYMAHRFERTLAQKLGLFQAINRLASNYRAEDLRDREGRKSWRAPRDVLADRPYLKAVVSRVRAGR